MRNDDITVTAIDHINLTVSDLDKSVAFYNDTFGLGIREDHRDDERPYVIVGKPGVGFMALHQRPPSPKSDTGRRRGRINHWGFVVDDFDSLIERLERHGVPVLYSDNGSDGIIDYPNSSSVYVADPDGTEIELTSRFGGGLG